MNAADFWNDQEAAQKTISEYKLLKAQTEGLEQAIASFDDACIGYELAREANDAELLEEADQNLFDLQKQMERVEFQSLLSGRHDHRQCFVSIQSGGGGNEARRGGGCRHGGRVTCTREGGGPSRKGRCVQTSEEGQRAFGQKQAAGERPLRAQAAGWLALWLRGVWV